MPYETEYHVQIKGRLASACCPDSIESLQQLFEGDRHRFSCPDIGAKNNARVLIR
jgi:hypothetical protein